MFQRLQVGSIPAWIAAISTAIYAWFYVLSYYRQDSGKLSVTIPWFGLVLVVVDVALIAVIFWRQRGDKIQSQGPKNESASPADESGTLAALGILKTICGDLLQSYRSLDIADKRVSQNPVSTSTWPNVTESSGWDYVALTLWRNYLRVNHLAKYQKVTWHVLGWRDTMELQDFRALTSVTTTTVTMAELLARLSKLERILDEKLSTLKLLPREEN